MLFVLFNKHRAKTICHQHIQIDTGRHTKTGTDSQDSLQSGTDSDSYSREGQPKTQGEQSREFKSGLTLGQMTPKGSALLISVFNSTVMHYW